YVIVRPLGRDHSLALCAAFLLVAPWFVVTWAPLGRVDMLACLFSVGGLGLFATAEDGRGGRWGTSGACLVLGASTTPTAPGALVTTAKAGAAQNYLIEPWLATVLLAALSLGALRERSPEVFRWWPAVMMVAALVALVANHQAARLPRPIRNPGQATEYRALDEAVAAAAGPILSENLSVLVRKGKPVLVEPFGMLLLSRKGLWRPDRP